MALKRSTKVFLWRSEVHVALALLLGWSAATLIAADAPRFVDRCVFTVLAAGASFVVLASLGYFESLRLIPRRSDFLVVLCAVPIGGGIARFGSALFALSSPGSSGGIVAASFCAAIITFVGHCLGSMWAVDAGKRRRIVLAVTPSERDAIIESYFPDEVTRYVEFIDGENLGREHERGAASEIDFIIISRSAVQAFDAEALLLRAHLAGIPIVDHRRILADLSGRIRLGDTDLWTYLLEATPQTPLLRLFGFLKTASEPIIAAVLGVLFAPIIIPLMVLIPLTSRGPIFYRQRRTGYLGRDFTLIKFRSMRVDAEAHGVRWASDNDDRTTPLGRFMRRTRLDELPQLWNVIRGEMSFVGPRPERPEIYAALKEKIPLFPMRTVVRPGITGWAQVYAGYAASIEESALKLEYDLFYIQNVSPRLDIVVLFKTIQVAVFGDAREPGKAAASTTGIAVHSRGA